MVWTPRYPSETLKVFHRSISRAPIETKNLHNLSTLLIPSGQWQPQSCFLFIVSRKGFYRRNEGDRKYQGNVEEAIVSMQKRCSYNQTFMRKIKKLWIQSRASVLSGRSLDKKIGASVFFFIDARAIAHKLFVFQSLYCFSETLKLLDKNLELVFVFEKLFGSETETQPKTK